MDLDDGIISTDVMKKREANLTLLFDTWSVIEFTIRKSRIRGNLVCEMAARDSEKTNPKFGAPIPLSSLTKTCKRTPSTSGAMTFGIFICKSLITFTLKVSTLLLSKASSSISTWPKHSPKLLNTFLVHACRGIPSKRIQHNQRFGPTTSVHLFSRSKRASDKFRLVWSMRWNSGPEDGFTQNTNWFECFTSAANPMCNFSHFSLPIALTSIWTPVCCSHKRIANLLQRGGHCFRHH